MNKFIGTKEVKARPLNLGAYNALRRWEMPVNENPNKEDTEDSGRTNTNMK